MLPEGVSLAAFRYAVKEKQAPAASSLNEDLRKFWIMTTLKF